MKLHLKDVTLCVIDTTSKVRLAVRAIDRCLDQATFADVKLFTHEHIPNEGTVVIPKITSLEGYSDFCIRELHKHIATSHVMIAQWDGYLLRAESWSNDFLKWDYIGSPWQPSNVNGNGGWSLRSKRLLEACSRIAETEGGHAHPEDAWICMHHRPRLESLGFKFAPLDVCRQWGFEGRSFDSVEWKGTPNTYNNECGFHSWLSKLPRLLGDPKIYHSSGDYGDLIYGLSVVKQMGDGVIFLSGDNRYPYPLNSRWGRTGAPAEWVDNIKPLLEEQSYVWKAQYTHATPFSTTCDLNAFRKPWKNRTARDFDSIFSLHHRVFGTTHPENEPWLTVTEPVTIPGRDIIVNRTARYHNDEVDWYSLVQVYSHRMAFIGTAQEASVFEGFATPKPVVPWIKTGNMLDMARVIAGGKVFIGNQSSALAIAHGLGKRVIVEEWPANRNCHLNRGDDAIYWNKGFVKIPESWL